MLDIIIKGGTVVTASSTFEADIGVKDEQIVLIGAPGTIQGEARRIIDASGKYVMPDGALRDPPPDMVHLGPTLPRRSRTVSPCNHMRHSPGYPHALPYTYSSHYEYIWQPHSQY